MEWLRGRVRDCLIRLEVDLEMIRWSCHCARYIFSVQFDAPRGLGLLTSRDRLFTHSFLSLHHTPCCKRRARPRHGQPDSQYGGRPHSRLSPLTSAILLSHKVGDARFLCQVLMEPAFVL